MASPSGSKHSSSASSKRTGQRRRRPVPRRDEPEPLPIFGGRLMNAALAGFAMLLIFPLDRTVVTPNPAPTDMSGWKTGGTGKVRLTVITMDYERLKCASETRFGKEHCEYKDTDTLFPREPGEPLDDNKKYIIQPYRTYPDNQLILVAGVWANPTIATRLHEEPWAGIPEQRQSRFVAECQVKFIGEIKDVKLRWKPDQKWNTEPKAMVAKAVSCRIGDTD